MRFVPLRIHTKYSPLLSVIEPVALAKSIESRGIEVCAVADRGVLFGWERTCAQLAGVNIDLLPGAEVEVLFPAAGEGAHPRVYTLNLYPISPSGLENLSLLTRSLWSDGRSERLRGIATLEEVEELSEGLLALSGGLTGPISAALLRGRIGDAFRSAARLCSTFTPDRFFLEVSRTGVEAEEVAAPFLRRLEKQHRIARVAADPVRYLVRGDHSRLAALRSFLPPQGKLSSPNPMDVEGHAHLPSAVEMMERYRSDPEPLERTNEIADRCRGSLAGYPPLSRNHETADAMIRICQAEINTRYQSEPVSKKTEIRNRFWSEYWKLEKEGTIPVIRALSGLFRSVRQSDPAAEIFTPFLSGSLIGYLLGLQETDPVKIGAGGCLETERGRSGRPQVRIVGDGRSIERFQSILNQRHGGRLQAHLTPVLLSQADRKRFEKTMLSSRGEWSGRHSNRPTQIPFEAKYRDNHRPDPLPEDELMTLPGKAVMTYRELESRVLWLDSVVEGWSRKGGFELEINRSPLMDAARATAGFSTTGDPFRCLLQGRWTGLVPGDYLLPKNLVRRLAPRSVGDIALLLASGADGDRSRELVERIARIRAGEKPVPLHGPNLDSILEATEGIPFFREQIVDSISAITGLNHEDSVAFHSRISRRNSVHITSDRALFIRSGMEKGASLKFLEKIFSILSALAPSAIGRGEVYPYAEKMILLLARKSGDPLRFVRNVLNGEMHARQKLHQLIEGFQKEGISFLPIDRNRSEYGFSSEGTSIRTGLVLVPGFTPDLAAKVVKERREGGEFHTIADFLQRLAALHFPRPALLRLAKALEDTRVKEEELASSGRRGPRMSDSSARGPARMGGRKKRNGSGMNGGRQISLPLEGIRIVSSR